MNFKIKLNTVFLLSILISFTVACSKSADPEIDRTGNYEGKIETYHDGKLFSTNNNGYFSLISTSTKGQFNILNNVIITSKANISGNTLTIPRTVSVSSQTASLVEYGSGTFNGNTLTFEFNSEYMDRGAVVMRLKFTGVLKKQ
jgi:hypothetical protein